MKRTNFEKIILLFLLGQIFTRITKKNVNFEILAHVPPFAKRKFFMTWQPCRRIWQSCLSEVLKNVTNRLLVPKNRYTQIFRSFRLLVQDLRSFHVFFEKISTAVISVSVFRCSRFTENLSPPIVFKISGCIFSAFYSQLNCL